MFALLFWQDVHACADPESFARGGPTLAKFVIFMRERGSK